MQSLQQFIQMHTSITFKRIHLDTFIQRDLQREKEG